MSCVFVSVDIMGGCGHIKCQARMGQDNCTRTVAENYKFYLSFENAICKEYVTEKLYQSMRRRMVPVVMGYGPYDNGFTPPHSVINFADFNSPYELAQHLLWLDKHQEEYLSYFWWTDYYTVSPPPKKTVACELCKKLHSKTEKRTVYTDIYKWWVEYGECIPWTEKLQQHRKGRETIVKYH